MFIAILKLYLESGHNLFHSVLLATHSWCAERGGRISQVVPLPSTQKSADNGGRLPIKVVATTIAQKSVYTINITKKEHGFNFSKIFSFNSLDCVLL